MNAERWLGRSSKKPAIGRVSVLAATGGILFCLIVLFCLICANLPQSNAQTPDHDMHRHRSIALMPTNSGDDKAQKSFVPPESVVFDQDGKKLHFYSDLVKGKLVVINFIYTTCKTICPTQGAAFSALQGRLGDRLGKQVYLVSISVDPEIDSPRRLKSWAARFGARKGWILITGKKTEMNNLVKALTGDPITKQFHGSEILIGNDRNGKWVREYGLANVNDLIKRIDDLGK